MKNAILLFILMALSHTLSSQGEAYTQAMVKGMELLQQAQNNDQFLAAANHFDRIAQVEKQQWYPAYYASFSRTIASTQFSSPDKVEELLDYAQQDLDKAAQLSDKNSEIQALQGFIHMLRIAVDPMTRGQQYSGMSSSSLQKAIALNSNNPRAAYLLAQLSYGTAQFFGSGAAESCQLNEKALALFAQEASNKDSKSFDPTWGREMAESFKEQCNN